MANKIELRTFVGKNIVTGEEVSYDQDEILCNGVRIGFVKHEENAWVRFLRVLTPPTAKEVLEKVAALRKEQNKPSISGNSSQPPNPAKIAAYMDSIDDGEDDDE